MKNLLAEHADKSFIPDSLVIPYTALYDYPRYQQIR